jgi:hypothetical protein
LDSVQYNAVQRPTAVAATQCSNCVALHFHTLHLHRSSSTSSTLGSVPRSSMLQWIPVARKIARKDVSWSRCIATRSSCPSRVHPRRLQHSTSPKLANFVGRDSSIPVRVGIKHLMANPSTAEADAFTDEAVSLHASTSGPLSGLTFASKDLYDVRFSYSKFWYSFAHAEVRG